MSRTQRLVAAAEREVAAAWKKVRRYGLEFGRVRYECQQKFKAQGSRNGRGLRPILDKVGIPRSTAYFWIDRYLASLPAGYIESGRV